MLGCEAAKGIEGFETMAACEISPLYRKPHQGRPQARATLALNRPGLFVYDGLEAYDYPADHYGLDLIAGGPPCQSFSVAGNRLGIDDPRGGLLLKFVELICELKPRTFIIENVPGLLSLDAGLVHYEVHSRLMNAGYLVRSQVVNAADHGLAQSRKRLFITGGLAGMPGAVEKTSGPVSLREAIGDLQGSEMEFDIPAPSVMRAISDPAHKAKRLSWDEPTPTLLTRPSGSKRSPLVHPDINRLLSIEECKRLQGFPASWKLAGSTRAKYQQLGNAVSVPVAQAVAQSLLCCL